MYFRFGTRKIVEAAGVLLRQEACRRMSYLRLLKLLYIADRESLRESGRPIVGTGAYAMKHGPVLSEVLDLVKGQHRDETVWSQFIRRDGYAVVLESDPGVGSLSRYEIGRLTQTADEHRDLNDWELVEETHGFQEWRENVVEGTSVAIPLADMVKAVGRDDELEVILQDAERSAALERLLGAVG